MEARLKETHSQEEGVAEKRARTQKNETETEAGRQEGPSQSQFKYGHMTNIYLTVSNEEAIVDFVKDHEEIYMTRLLNISRTKQGRSAFLPLFCGFVPDFPTFAMNPRVIESVTGLVLVEHPQKQTQSWGFMSRSTANVILVQVFSIATCMG